MEWTVLWHFGIFFGIVLAAARIATQTAANKTILGQIERPTTQFTFNLLPK